MVNSDIELEPWMLDKCLFKMLANYSSIYDDALSTILSTITLDANKRELILSTARKNESIIEIYLPYVEEIDTRIISMIASYKNSVYCLKMDRIKEAMRNSSDNLWLFCVTFLEKYDELEEAIKALDPPHEILIELICKSIVSGHLLIIRKVLFCIEISKEAEQVLIKQSERFGSGEKVKEILFGKEPEEPTKKKRKILK
jgi:hypothetical protein